MSALPGDPVPGEYRFAFISNVGRRFVYVISLTRSLDVVIVYAITCRLGTVRWSKPTTVFFVDVIRGERPSLYDIENVTAIIGHPLASLAKATP